MDIMEQIFANAKAKMRKVAFPETDEEKILKAAEECVKRGLCKPVLVGKKAEILESLSRYQIDFTGMEIADSSDETWLESLIMKYTADNELYSVKTMRRKSKDALYVALMMEAAGMVDVTFAGMSHTTGDVIIAGQMVVGLAEGVTTVSSVGITKVPGYEGSEGSLIVIGDSAVCQNPSEEDLASIAISACDTTKSLLGWEPRCAMVSFSTTGSAESPMIDRIIAAKEIANKRRPDLKIDGEFQLDAAINPVIAAKKVKRESAVAGKANIIIWPDLNAGNISVKLLQQFAHADSYGPILQGFKKVVCDCSRSAPVSEVVGNIAISVVRSQGGRADERI